MADKSNKYVTLGIRVSKDFRDKFWEVCNDKCINPSELIRRLMADWLKANAK